MDEERTDKQYVTDYLIHSTICRYQALCSTWPSLTWRKRLIVSREMLSGGQCASLE